jgi:3-oxoacyl-[acyl-carrier protein] reductase
MTKLAIITGASKGIGAATALAFARAGYDIVINYLSDTAAAEATAADARKNGVKAEIIQSDIFTEAGIHSLRETIGNRLIDVLVCNAGLPEEKPYGEWTTTDILSSLTRNFAGAALCAQELEPSIKDGGSILFTSSIYGLPHGASPVLPLYSAGKAAIISLTQSLAEKLAPRIRCNAVAPGTTKTPAWDGVNPDYAQKSLDMTLLKEWVTAEEIGKTFVFLAEMPHITAQTVVVDAGWQKKIRSESPVR